MSDVRRMSVDAAASIGANPMRCGVNSTDTDGDRVICQLFILHPEPHSWRKVEPFEPEPPQ